MDPFITGLARQLTAGIREGNAHLTFDEVVQDIPFSITGIKPHQVPYSIWQLVEHLRIAQWDILEFSRGPDHISPKWPEAYWPKAVAPEDEHKWRQAIEKIRGDRQAFIDLISNAGIDLLKPFPYGEGQNLLREAILIIDHNSYHTGQILLLKRLLMNT